MASGMLTDFMACWTPAATSWMSRVNRCSSALAAMPFWLDACPLLADATDPGIVADRPAAAAAPVRLDLVVGAPIGGNARAT